MSGHTLLDITLHIHIHTQSVIAKGILNSLQEQGNLVPVIINFSAQTSSGRTQEIIEGKLEKKRKTILGELHALLVYIYTSGLV